MVAKEISTRLVNRKGSWLTAIDVVIDTVVLLPLRGHPSRVPIAGQPSLFCLTLKSSTIYDLAWAHLYSLMYCPLIMLNHTPCPRCSPWILAWGSHLYWQMVSPCFQAWLNHFFWKHFWLTAPCLRKWTDSSDIWSCHFYRRPLFIFLFM